VAQATDIQTFRAEFPLTDRAAFLNHAAYGPFPTRTVAAVQQFAAQFADPTEFFASERADLPGETAALVAEMAGADAANVAFVPTLADGMSLLATGVDWREGDNVLIPVDEFPSLVYPFLNLAHRGVSVRFVPKNDAGRTDVALLEAAMDGRTRAVALSHVEYMDGFRNDLVELGTLCQARGIELFVDATQSLCAQPIDVNTCGVTAIAAHGYKWLMGSFGIGVVVFAPGAVERIRPTYAGRLSVDAGFEDHEYRLEWRSGAARYQTGGHNLLGLTAMRTSLTLIREAGPVWTAQHTLGLNDRLLAGVSEMGYTVASDMDPRHRSQIVAFSSGDPIRDGELVDELERAHVSVTLRGRGVRVSPYFYNTLADVERLLEALPPR
jgi:cysteine desulfurase/selenocysteine lyase